MSFFILNQEENKWKYQIKIINNVFNEISN